MAKDKLRVDSLNRYLYVVNNPVNLVDPSGLSAFPIMVMPDESLDILKKIEERNKYIDNKIKENCKLEDLEYDVEKVIVIIKNKQNILNSANYFGIDPNILAGSIFAEQSLNYDFKDTFTDWLGFYGNKTSIIDTSVGVAQVKVNTAKLVEDEGYMSKIKAKDGGWKIPFTNKIIYGTENMVREKYLENDSVNIKYAAAYIKLLSDRWRKDFTEIDNKPDILGTLYNLGHELEPHNAPKANPFGEYVKKYYNLMDYIMKEEWELWRYEEMA